MYLISRSRGRIYIRRKGGDVTVIDSIHCYQNHNKHTLQCQAKITGRMVNAYRSVGGFPGKDSHFPERVKNYLRQWNCLKSGLFLTRYKV